MELEIITPDKVLFSGEATGVQLPGAEGSFEILRNHAPMISRLKAGKVRIRNGKDTHYVDINGGIVEVLKNKVVVLT